MAATSFPAAKKKRQVMMKEHFEIIQPNDTECDAPVE